MRVLVTGAAGYIGSITTELLLEAGNDVIALDTLERGHREAVHEAATFVQADLRDQAAMRSVFEEHRPDAVLHFAAYALVGESMERPTLYFTNNVGGSANLIDAMLASGCRRIVFSSSCTVYGKPDHIPVTEDTPRAALNPYGASKIMVEDMLLWHARLSGMQVAILRYFNPAGASERFGEDRPVEMRLIPFALAAAAGDQPHVTIFGTDYPTPDGTCIRDYIDVVDLAEAHTCALTALDREPLLVVNLGTGRGVSVREIITAVEQVTGRAVPVVEGARRPGGADSPAVYADPSRAHHVLGWQAKRGLDETIRSAWAWRERHPAGYASLRQPAPVIRDRH